MAQDHPRLARIRRYIRVSQILGGCFAVLGIIFMLPAIFLSPEWPAFVVTLTSPLAYLGGALQLSSAAFLSAGTAALLRVGGEPRKTKGDGPARAPRNAGLSRRIVVALSGVRQGLAAWSPVLIPIILSVGAASSALYGWWAGDVYSPLETAHRQYFGGTLIVAAFPLLVLERTFAGLDSDVLPEGGSINRLLRLLLTSAIVLGIQGLLLASGVESARLLGMAIAILVFAVATEVALRCFATLFLPTAPLHERRSPVDSALAGLLRLQIPRWSRFSIAVRNQFGIDLSRSWALSYVQQAFFPLAAGTAVFIWLLTGVTAIPVAERGVYEKLGRSVQVLHAGLHLHLPWPFGVVRRLEHGVIHELPVTALTVDDDVASAPIPPLADGPAPPTADRLWTSYHPSETTYLIASAADGTQGFQVVNIDLTVVYRIGLDDEDAMRAAYNIAQPARLISARAGRLLAQHFARYTLTDVLGQNRAVLAENFRSALQADLDAAESGIEAIAVIVEAIHPPPGAAQAYHNVQASRIYSLVNVARAQGGAERVLKAAQRTADQTTSAAAARAVEIVTQAEAEATRFATDRVSYGRARTPFLLERWFEKLTQNLAGQDLTVIDHRLSGPAAPTIDFRGFSPRAPAYVPPLPEPMDDHD